MIDRTVHGARIERFKPRGNRQPFHTLEIHTEEGDILGHLNMIYMKRAIACYYLVYVDVTDRFRGLGLGNRILRTFMEFVEDKKAVGLLDNIIPPEEVTYEIYTRLGWKKIKDLFGDAVTNGWGNYMVFVPDSVQVPDLKDRLIRFLFALSKKRPVIDMHDNEDMVKRTIEEFRSIYLALEELYKAEISSRVSTPLMRFMFTRLTTKLIGFRRRIAALIGYTGGESLDQIHFTGRVKRLHIQPYSLWGTEKNHAGIWGDRTLLATLPDRLRHKPTFFIENLPLYRRPYLRDRMEKAGAHSSRHLRISDLLDLGLDPTRLREFHHQGVDYIFERVSPHFFHVLGRKRRLLKEVEEKGCGVEVSWGRPSDQPSPSRLPGLRKHLCPAKEGGRHPLGRGVRSAQDLFPAPGDESRRGHRSRHGRYDSRISGNGWRRDSSPASGRRLKTLPISCPGISRRIFPGSRSRFQVFHWMKSGSREESVGPAIRRTALPIRRLAPVRL